MKNRLRYACAVLLLLLLPVQCASPTVELEPYEGTTTTLPSEVWRHYFMLPLTFGGDQERTLWFLFDTGANIHVVDPDALRAVSDWEGNAGGTVNLLDMHCGEVRFDKIPARVNDLDHIERTLGRRIDGILGFPAFKQVLMTIDYGTNEMRVAEGALARPDGDSIFALKNAGNRRPWVDLDLGGRRHRVLIDSGSGGFLALKGIDDEPWEAAPRAVGTVMGYTGLEHRFLGRLQGPLLLFGLEFEAPVVRLAMDGTDLVGTRYLKHFVLTFDQRQHRVRIAHLAEGPVPPKTFEGTGTLTEARPEGLLVRGVTPNSPAEAAGLQPNDLILEVSGVRFDRRPAEGFEPLQDGERVFHRFRLMRGGEELILEADEVDLLALPVRE